MLNRLNSNHSLAEQIVIENWLMQWDPGDVPLQHILNLTRPRTLVPASRPIAVSISHVLVIGRNSMLPGILVAATVGAVITEQ
jgi:hypothetical protein